MHAYQSPCLPPKACLLFSHWMQNREALHKVFCHLHDRQTHTAALPKDRLSGFNRTKRLLIQAQNMSWMSYWIETITEKNAVDHLNVDCVWTTRCEQQACGKDVRNSVFHNYHIIQMLDSLLRINEAAAVTVTCTVWPSLACLSLWACLSFWIFSVFLFSQLNPCVCFSFSPSVLPGGKLDGNS